MYKIELEQFSGPLDLLLNLIESQEMEISKVSLAKVTDQYLKYIDTLSEISAAELADFLVVATKLLIIKSKGILPTQENDQEDDAASLENQLKMYKEYLAACKKIEEMIKEKNFSFSRERIPISWTISFSPPPACASADLKEVFEQILKRIEFVVNLPQRVLEKVVSLSEMVSNLKLNLDKAKKLDFKSIIENAKSKTEIVVCFMALLELIKSGEAAVNQKNIFEDITVERI